MAVTTREYALTATRPKDVIQSLHDAITDLGWFEPQPLGYLCNFINTPGSTLKNRANERYLVSPSSTTAPSGTGAVFDVLRTPVGGISAVTIVTGGSGYNILGQINCSSSGTTITVPSTTGINVGMVVTRVAGTGTLAVNTLVTEVTSSTTLVVNQAPTVTLSGATLTFADTLTLAATDIGGSTYTVTATGTSGQTTIVVSDADNVFIGQLVTGSGIGPLATVSSISGTTVTLSRANTGTVNGNVIFSDEILVTVTGSANIENISGTASGLTITNVATNQNIYVGAAVELQSGTPTWDSSNGRVIISTITGSGPYTITLRNEENTFKGFDTTGAITFRVTSGTNVNWLHLDAYTAPQTYVWAVAKIENSADRLGNTFWLFYAGYNTTLNNGITLLVRPLSGFNSLTATGQGVAGLDLVGAGTATTVSAMHLNILVASSAYVPITLRVRQSGIDPNFATFSFFEGNNNRNPFFLSKFDTAIQPWVDYNNVWLGGITEVFQAPAFNVSDAGILFRTRLNVPKRMAEAGYGNYNIAAAVAYTNTYFRSVTGNRPLATPSAVYDDIALYSRQTGDIQTTVTTQYPIYNTIPVNPHFLPVPYYLPNDFVIMEIPWANPAIRDTVTVSGSEVYTIIQLATNQTTFSAIAFAARTT